MINNELPFIILTGAGASRAEPIKLPTMTEFFQRIMDENRMPLSPRISDSGYFKFIIDTLYGSENNYDLERIMGALYGLTNFTNSDCWKIFQHPVIYDNIEKELVAVYGKQGAFSGKPYIERATQRTHQKYQEDAKSLIFELEWLIRDAYEEIPIEDIDQVYEPFFNLLFEKVIGDDSKAKIVPFFTTNYDMSVDWFFSPLQDNAYEHRLRWLNSFDIKVEFIDGFDGRGWNQEEYKKIQSNGKKLYVPYFKLHGSLYWEKVQGRIMKGTNIANDPHSPRDLMIVYPSDKKILSEQPYYFNQKSLERYIKRTNTAIIIGFSFRDPAIVRVFESAMDENPSLRVFVVGPEFDREYFKEMAQFINHGQVEHIVGYFGQDEVLRQLDDVL